MNLRARVLAAAVATGMGCIVAAGPARAEPIHSGTNHQSTRPMNYWYVEGHYATQAECQAKGESLLWPTNPGGADDYECRANGDGWDLWLMFLT